MGAQSMRQPIIRIANGTFYRHHPSSGVSAASNPPLFAGLNLELPSHSSRPQSWCIVGPSLSGKTTLLQILRGQHLCLPPTARSYPYLATDAVSHRLRTPSRAIQYVGFDSGGGSGLGPATSAYLSARYESRREKTDFSLQDFLLGNTQLNAADVGPDMSVETERLLKRVVADLRLESLLQLPVAFLSNGQGRRARIARALLTGPEVLLLDEPFMGLDPPTVAGLSPLLQELAEKAAPRLILTARPQDPLPHWITHLIYLRTDCQVGFKGEKEGVTEKLQSYTKRVLVDGAEEDDKMPVHALREMGRTLTPKGIEGHGLAAQVTEARVRGSNHPRKVESSSTTKRANGPREKLVEMDGCQVRYGNRVVLGNWSVDGNKGLHWTVRRGERWGVFGPNGSGKTTIVSLLCSDHPQTYSLPIKLFGRSRLPDPSSDEFPLTFWDIQSRVGHSSPEIHQHMPRHLTIREVVQSAWADTFRSKPTMDAAARAQVDAILRWFATELDPSSTKHTNDLDWPDKYMFGELSFSAQRVLLFLRAVAKHSDIIVLDEAFSGMDEAVRDKCMIFLEHGSTLTEPTAKSRLKDMGSSAVKGSGLSEDQALICISHVREEVPDCVREWMCLPEANTGRPARFGRLDGPLRSDWSAWQEIWEGQRAE